MLGSAKRLISREFPWNYFPRFLTYVIEIPQRHGQTGRRTDGCTTCHGNTALWLASRGKRGNEIMMLEETEQWYLGSMCRVIEIFLSVGMRHTSWITTDNVEVGASRQARLTMPLNLSWHNSTHAYSFTVNLCHVSVLSSHNHNSHSPCPLGWC